MSGERSIAAYLTRAHAAQVQVGDFAALEPKPGERVRIEGYASVFGPPADADGAVFAPGAFAKAARRVRRRRDLPLVLVHDVSQRVGTVTDAREDRTGLRFRAVLAETPEARSAAAAIRAGAIHAASVHAQPIRKRDEEWEGRFVRRIEEATLEEITVTSAPKNRRAVILRAWTETEEERTPC